MPLVKLYASLRVAAGKKELRLPGSNVRAVLEALDQALPSLTPLLFEAEEVRSHLIITLNGQPLDASVTLEVPVAEEDVIAIFPPVAGG